MDLLLLANMDLLLLAAPAGIVVVGAIMALISFTDLRSTKSVVIFFICMAITVTVVTMTLVIGHQTVEVKYGTLTPKAWLTLAPKKQVNVSDLYDVDFDASFEYEPSATIVYARWSDGSSDGINLNSYYLSYDYDKDRVGDTLIVVMETNQHNVFEASIMAV